MSFIVRLSYLTFTPSNIYRGAIGNEEEEEEIEENILILYSTLLLSLYLLYILLSFYSKDILNLQYKINLTLIKLFVNNSFECIYHTFFFFICERKKDHIIKDNIFGEQ